MYLHLGQAVVVNQRDIVAIFDMDNATWAHRTRAFLEKAEQEGRVVNAASDLPRSFVVCRGKRGEQTVYLSQLSSATLKGRVEEGWLE